MFTVELPELSFAYPIIYAIYIHGRIDNWVDRGHSPQVSALSWGLGVLSLWYEVLCMSHRTSVRRPPPIQWIIQSSESVSLSPRRQKVCVKTVFAKTTRFFPKPLPIKKEVYILNRLHSSNVLSCILPYSRAICIVQHPWVVELLTAEGALLKCTE